MKKISAFFLFCLIFVPHAYAATCNLGYYNQGDECIECEPGYFCAAGVRTACADATNNLYPYSDTGAYDAVWCYLETVPGKYVGASHGGLVDCGAGAYCPGNVRVYYGLPDGYRMTKYTTINNLAHSTNLPEVYNGVNTGIMFKESDAIDFAFSMTDDADPRIVFVAGYGINNGLAMAYIAAQSENMYQLNLNGSLYPVLSRQQIGDGKFRSVRFDFSNDLSLPIYFGSWTDWFWSRTINWYGFKISKSGTVLQNLIPCVRESDGLAGFYDTVGGAFHANHEFGGLPFTAGDVADSFTCPVGMYYAGRGVCRPTHIINFGDYRLYLNNAQRTHPSLAVQIGDATFYGDMAPGRDRGHLRTEYNGAIYSIYNMDLIN